MDKRFHYSVHLGVILLCGIMTAMMLLVVGICCVHRDVQNAIAGGVLSALFVLGGFLSWREYKKDIG